MASEMIFANGVDAATGGYLQPPMTIEQLARQIRGRPVVLGEVEELENRLEVLEREHLGTKEGIDPKALVQSGWGVIFTENADPAVRAALAPLLAHRREQAAAKHEQRYRELTYQPGDSEWDFLDRHEADFGPADPEKLPYYLLLVGGPEQIPFDFQYQLDVEYAVGRLALATVEEYAAYAEAVVEAERAAPPESPAAAFFAVRNPDDRSTEQSHDFLVEPLAELLGPGLEKSGWQVETQLGEAATKQSLARLLGGEATPTFLLSASHGLACSAGHPRQRARQGALLCQDWPGPEAWKGQAICDAHCFAADDLASDARLRGLVTFHFSCYGGGTPEPAAPQAFVARLPQRLLAQGALAVIAHVDMSWAYSYLGLEGGERLEVFESTLRRLLGGHPVGSAMEYFNRRYANLATALGRERDAVERHGKRPDDRRLARLWTASEDARSYTVLGDPAVRVRGAAEHEIAFLRGRTS